MQVKILKLFVLISTFVVASTELQAQGCLDNIEDASRAYYNGRFEEVISLLDCDISEFDKKDQTDILELLIKSNLLLENNEPADQYMAELLTINPLYQPRTSDILLYRELYETYSIINTWNFGIVAGFNLPNFEIIKHQSIGSVVSEPASYDQSSGLILGFNSERLVFNNLYIGLGFIYENFTYSYSELILDYQQLDVAEKINVLNVPLTLRYELPVLGFKPFVNAGVAAHFLLRSNLSLDLRAIDTNTPVAYVGIPYKTDQYNASAQRQSLTLNYQFGGGIRKSLGTFHIELAINYQFGINNLVSVQNRYTDNKLIETYAYVPDDIKLNHFIINFGVYKSILKPKK